MKSAEQIWMAFCHYSMHFSSRENTVSWFEDKSVDPITLSLDETYEVAGRWFESTLQFAEATRISLVSRVEVFQELTLLKRERI